MVSFIADFFERGNSCPKAVKISRSTMKRSSNLYHAEKKIALAPLGGNRKGVIG